MTSLFSDVDNDSVEAHMNEYAFSETPASDDDVAPRERGPIGPNILDENTEFPGEPRTKRRNTQLKTGLTTLYAGVGTMVFTFDQQVGQVILQNAENCAESLDQLARENPKVKRALEGIMETSAWSGVIMAHLPIAVMIGTKYVPYLRDQYNGLYEQATTPE